MQIMTFEFKLSTTLSCGSKVYVRWSSKVTRPWKHNLKKKPVFAEIDIKNLRFKGKKVKVDKIPGLMDYLEPLMLKEMQIKFKQN